MKKVALILGALAMLAIGATSCKGRTQDNTSNGDTVEVNGGEVIDGGEVVMPDSANDSVIATSPAENGQ